MHKKWDKEFGKEVIDEFEKRAMLFENPRELEHKVFKAIKNTRENAKTNSKIKLTRYNAQWCRRHLGDIVKDDDVSAIKIFEKLKGHKHFIVGNHDHLILEEIRKSNIFESVKFIDLIMDKDRKVCICHYPLMDWMEFNREGILVYGHIHNKTPKNGYAYKMMKDYYANLPAYNCGVDVCEFEPRTLDELIHLKEVNKDEPYIN